ncbi:uncharacterized protein si:ch211-214p13.7 [Clupea harengus]|uniref:Uncharacterized protein si:ch211-214p13.7 n=1 Tax=Clupea harengus TaxID=7950 RepID=A0A8M1KVX2_CLUHA|nr:uncharacterized protein si:ch211-214p13.7 [Clupea harengus]
MGNLICGAGRKKTSEAKNESDDNTNADNTGKDTPGTQPKEEVLYATIDHGNGKKAGNVMRIVEGDDCDYAVVNIPSEDKLSIKEDCSDDYVLMG